MTLCQEAPDLFFSAEEDGRMETDRVEREELASSLCFTCPTRLRCLERAMVLGEAYGVWGGMGEHERRMFRKHMKDEGYRNEVPAGPEFRASLKAFYRERGVA